MIRRIVAIAAFSFIGQIIGCAWLASGTYGGELGVCTDKATLEQGEACCVESAKKRGRDASFCILDAGGQ